MAKNFQLIEGRDDNWRVAIFLLINHLHPEIQAGNWFSRTTMTSTFRALKFIENLLGQIGYEVNNTLENSISSAITKMVKSGDFMCVEGQCKLTLSGFNEFKTTIVAYIKNEKYPVGKMKHISEMLSTLSENEINKIKDLIKKNQK